MAVVTPEKGVCQLDKGVPRRENRMACPGNRGKASGNHHGGLGSVSKGLTTFRGKYYLPRKVLISCVWLHEFSESPYTCVASGQVKRQDIASTQDSPLVPPPGLSPPFPPKGTSGLTLVRLHLCLKFA